MRSSSSRAIRWARRQPSRSGARNPRQRRGRNRPPSRAAPPAPNPAARRAARRVLGASVAYAPGNPRLYDHLTHDFAVGEAVERLVDLIELDGAAAQLVDRQSTLT